MQMALVQRLESTNTYWHCAPERWQHKGDDTEGFTVGLLTHADTMDCLKFMFVVSPEGITTQPNTLRDLDWPKWVLTIWSTPITGWYTAPLLGADSADTFTNARIATSKSNLKREQMLGAVRRTAPTPRLLSGFQSQPEAFSMLESPMIPTEASSSLTLPRYTRR